MIRQLLLSVTLLFFLVGAVVAQEYDLNVVKRNGDSILVERGRKIVLFTENGKVKGRFNSLNEDTVFVANGANPIKEINSIALTDISAIKFQTKKREEIAAILGATTPSGPFILYLGILSGFGGGQGYNGALTFSLLISGPAITIMYPATLAILLGKKKHRVGVRKQLISAKRFDFSNSKLNRKDYLRCRYLRTYDLNGKKIAFGKVYSINDSILQLGNKSSNLKTILIDSVGKVKTNRPFHHSVMTGAAIGTGYPILGTILGAIGGAVIYPLIHKRSYQIDGDYAKWNEFQQEENTLRNKYEKDNGP